MSAAGYSGTPLVKKLGIKPGFRLVVRSAPADYWDLLGQLPDDVTVVQRASSKPLDFVHVFAKRRSDLDKAVKKYKGLIAPTGMIWVSWPKKSSGVATEIDESVVRRTGLGAGLVDVKICAVDETWSGLKFVIRVKDRKK